MADAPRIALALTFAVAIAYALTPVAIQAAMRLEFFDRPRGYKGHAKPVPYLGGSAVLAGFLAVLAMLAGDPGRTLPLAAGVAILWAVGTVDDRRNVSPLIRVLVEIAIAVGWWAADLGWDLGTAWPIELALTVIWILAVVNAFNLFDNMDGASSAMAAVVSGAVAILGIVQGDAWLTVAAVGLGGACIGFLPYNLARPQARIFLGDGGSMPIGFAVAALVMIGATGAADGWESLALGMLLVGVPAADTALVIVSRRRKGISVLTGGRDHLTHRARRRLGTAQAVAFTLGATQAVLASVALVALDVGPFALIVLTVLALATAGTAIALLEREEDRLLASGEISVPDAALELARAKSERRPNPLTVGDLALVALAGGAALSPFWFGFYDSRSWVPLGLVLVLAGTMGAIRRPQRLGSPAWLVLGGLVGIGLLGLLSILWAAAPDDANVSANRWLVLAAVLGCALILLRSTARDVLALAVLGGGTLLVAGYVLVQMLGSGGPDLFLGGRLNEPLGYINGEATVFLMGAWLAVGLAERRHPVAAGAGLAATVLFAGLVLLSASRGVVVASVVSSVVVLAAVPGRQRRILAIGALGLTLAAVADPLLAVLSSAQTAADRTVPEAITSHAAWTLLTGAIIAGGAWGAAIALHRNLTQGAKRQADLIGRVAIGLAAVALLVVGVASADRISSRLSTQWQTFTQVQTATDPEEPAAPESGTTRLASGAGNRYEYWRVAWNAFVEHPVGGLGAGNFGQAWQAERRVSEDIRQPHSIELQVLSELGVPGGLLLLLVLGGTAIAIFRVHQSALPGTATGMVAVSAVGVPVAWLAHTSVDWQHLLPGTTAVALICLAILLRQPDRIPASRSVPEPVSRGVLIAGALVVALTVATVGATLTRQAFADHYRSAAFAAIASDPELAIRQADRSLRLNADAQRSYFAKAAALARMGEGPAAAAVLRQAIAREPTNPVSWALLGDLETRRGREAIAARAYREALRLNPLDPGYQELAERTGDAAAVAR